MHPSQAPNAALLIDFDNVTMGMRSDLSKELKTLLNSEVIRGKVTVQRAYADWRRYPQYIVPLSEASIDLIFAPAYGSSKKNATDIRMAIDGMELVFTRPEIGTYILLTGDSDFSSLVLKLKEYGKYVIGVGIQESSSDILVQNCDEYYSYTSLSGLRKTDDAGGSQLDPWMLVERAVEQMTRREDVMRSDRLKQVMLEIDPGFDEKGLGFSKFSRFLTEAGKKGLIQLQRMENGQYEIVPPKGARKTEERKAGTGERDGRRGDRSRSERGRPAPDAGRTRDSEAVRTPAESTKVPVTPRVESEPAAPAGDASALVGAYDLLRRAIGDLLEDQGTDAARDSDVKRRMLALEGGFDETTLGFPKFSRFLQQAQEHEVIELRKGGAGHYEVALGPKSAPPAEREPAAEGPVAKGGTVATPVTPPTPETPGARVSVDSGGPPARPSSPAGTRSDVGSVPAGRLRPRESKTGPKGRGDEHPPLLEGQIVRSPRAATPTPPDRRAGGKTQEVSTPEDPAPIDLAALRLPTGSESVIQYLSNSYAGVGKKTAETLVAALGEQLFHVLHTQPSRVEEILTAGRAERLLEGWQADYQRRSERLRAMKRSEPPSGTSAPASAEAPAPSLPEEPAPSRPEEQASTTVPPEEDGEAPPAPRRGGRTRRTRGTR